MSAERFFQACDAILRQIRETVEDVYATSFLDPDVVELRNIALLGELIVLCARDRRESRGLHATPDHPGKLPEARDTVLVRRDPRPEMRASEPGPARDHG